MHASCSVWISQKKKNILQYVYFWNVHNTRIDFPESPLNTSYFLVYILIIHLCVCFPLQEFALIEYNAFYIPRTFSYLVGRKSQLPAQQKLEQNKTKIGTKFQHVLIFQGILCLVLVNFTIFSVKEIKTIHSRNLWR